MTADDSNSVEPDGARSVRSFPVGPSPVRGQNLDRLRRESFDLLVIGGGITGSGIALDAVLRGLRVALVDKGDFGSGTSSSSSKLIHGGLRYLEYGEFRLVREALRERHTLLRIAPHLVWPLRMLVPHYSGSGRPSWMVKVGLTLYDWLAGRERIGRHRKLSVGELVGEIAGMRTEGLKGGYEFFDAQMDDARLCLEVVLTGMASGVVAANYVEVVRMRQERGAVCGCELIDRMTGECFYTPARRVVNAAGPWLDQVCRIDDSNAPVRLAASKGVHIILPNMDLRAGLLIIHPADGRVMFVLPWMNRTLVGTTDTLTDAGPDEVAAEPADSDYLLAAINHYLGRSFARSDVIGTLAGMRPLLNQNVKQPSAASREFAIVRARSGLWSIAGGKYTTYRSMAEKLVDQVVADLGGSVVATPSRTATHRLVGAPVEDWQQFHARERRELIAAYPVASNHIDHLLNRYGARARLLVTDHGADPSLWRQVVAGEPEIWAEFHYQAQHEMAILPADHLLRRTRLGLFRPSEFPASLTRRISIHTNPTRERGTDHT